MKKRLIKENVWWLGAVDWDRRLFDALIPLPEGTSYNAYLVKGSKKTVLFDTVEPAKSEFLLAQLADVERIDYIVSHHAEQDHSGSLPAVLARYPKARLICSPKAREMLIDLLHIEPDRFQTVDDGDLLSLGDKNIQFVHTPWVHWPETMCTFLREDNILFSCDFFGAHIASADLYARDWGKVRSAAKRYFAEIMMPFRKPIQDNMTRIGLLPIELIAPSHGPIHDQPARILDAYRGWSSDHPRNLVILPYISMHGSTKTMVERLIEALVDREIAVAPFDLAVTDLGILAQSLVDAATIVVGTPTVLYGAHPTVFGAANLMAALRPKAKFLSVIGSFGWGSKAVEQLTGLFTKLKPEILDPVFIRGCPAECSFEEIDRLADDIASRHRTLFED